MMEWFLIPRYEIATCFIVPDQFDKIYALVLDFCVVFCL